MSSRDGDVPWSALEGSSPRRSGPWHAASVACTSAAVAGMSMPMPDPRTLSLTTTPLTRNGRSSPVGVGPRRGTTRSPAHQRWPQRGLRLGAGRRVTGGPASSGSSCARSCENDADLHAGSMVRSIDPTEGDRPTCSRRVPSTARASRDAIRLGWTGAACKTAIALPGYGCSMASLSVRSWLGLSTKLVLRQLGRPRST